MAARFAAQARDAIAAAVDAGATPAELAWELDYPGGHAAMDGPHIDRQIAELPAGTPDRDRAPATATSLAAAAAAVAAATAAADAAEDDARPAGPTRPLAPRRPRRHGGGRARPHRRRTTDGPDDAPAPTPMPARTRHRHSGSAGPTPGSGARALRAAIWLPGLAVALGAAVATAHGLYEVAVAARVPAGIAWLYPLITDGLALVAYAATARLTGSGRPLRLGRRRARRRPVRARPSRLPRRRRRAARLAPALRFGVGAWPAVAAAIVAHLLYLLATARRPADSRRRRRPAATPAAFNRLPFSPYSRCSTRRDRRVQPDRAASAAGRLRQADHAEPALNGPARRAVQPPATDPAEQPDRHRSAAPIAGAGPGAGGRGAARRTATAPCPPSPSSSALAEVSRGTAAAALKALREQPDPAAPRPRQPRPRTPSHDPRTATSAHDPSTPAPERPTTIRATRTATEHYSIKTSDKPESEPQQLQDQRTHTYASRSAGSGRPPAGRDRALRAVDLAGDRRDDRFGVVGVLRIAPRLQPGVPAEGGRDRAGELLHRRGRRRASRRAAGGAPARSRSA